MKNYDLELIEIITHCCDVKTFRFALDEGINYKAGQYLVLTLNIDGKEDFRALSISSSPTEKGYLEFTKKLTDSNFSQALNTLEIGKSYPIRLPMGKFTFEGEYASAVFLSGGIGITPIRSIFKYVTDKRLSSRLTLLYSSRTPEYLIFKNDFKVMQEANKNLKLVYTLTDCLDRLPDCRVGRIDESLIKEVAPDYKQQKFFICGPPAMVSAMQMVLTEKLAVPAANIVLENFTGY